MNRIIGILFLFGTSLLLSACGDSPEASANNTAEKPVRAVPVTITNVKTQALDVTLNSVGALESLETPMIAAETDGRVLKINVDEGDLVESGMVLAMLDPEGHRIAMQEAAADLKRLKALIANQHRILKRLKSLEASQSVSKERLDEASTQLVALQAQESAAQSRLSGARYRLSKTEITAPVSGRIQRRQVSVGDYVGPGNSMFQIVTVNTLRVRLPFPEGVATQLRPGQKVRLATATNLNQTAEGVLKEVRPAVDTGNRALNVILDIENPGGWLPGASITGEVITHTYEEAMMVPTLSVVRRPIGDVVYVLGFENKVQQHVVKTGRLMGDHMHIIEGLQTGDRVVVDGAAFLTDQAVVTVQESESKQGS
ncbi:MAG: efflux RND transporter periplasmic adaptor subunit [Pseudomonadota bacterium]